MKYTLGVIALAVIILSCNQENTELEVNQVVKAEDITSCGSTPLASAEIENYKIKSISLIPEALGVYGRTIQTKSEEAQDFFNQGIQLRYAFAVSEAISSFREAQKLDSTSAMFYWGEAWALGSYLNGHMRANKSSLALKATQKGVGSILLL